MAAKMRVWGLKTCDRCRKAVRALEAAGYAPEVIDVRADGVAPEDLARFQAAFGAALVNKRSTTWRELSAEVQGAVDQDAAGEGARALLLAHPTLMKRPVVEAPLEGEMRLTLGWDAKVAALWTAGMTGA